MRTPCCEKMGLKKGPWTPEEDHILISFIQQYGHGNWRALPKQAGLLRCGKSCRLRWINYLRPDIKRGSFSKEEEETIIKLHQLLGNRWSAIAAKLPGRTDNEIKNFWHTHLKKKLQRSSCSAATNTPPMMNTDTIYKHYSNGLLLSKYANIPMNSTTVQTMTQNTSPDHHAMVVAPAVIQSLAISNPDQHSATSSVAKMQPTKDHATWTASDVITRSLTDGKSSAIKGLSAVAEYPTDDQSNLAHTMMENYNDIVGKKINKDIDFWYNLFMKSGEPSRPS